ncbi:MAG: hypothetical protein HQK64_08350 [Desulfamplus sp.]|nr:hypothetical protein [Desulfamplus sp.]
MVVDSIDKKKFAPTIRSLETETKIDTGQKSFKSILENESNLVLENSRRDKGAVNSRANIEVKQAVSKGSSYELRSNNSNNNKSDGTTGDSQKIHIGTLSGDTPTVSELLYNTKYKNNCWQMLQSDVNSSKHFRKIPAGTDIFLDKSTSEIVWGDKATLFTKELKSGKEPKKIAIQNGENSALIGSTSSRYRSNSTNYNLAPTDNLKSTGRYEPQTKAALNDAVKEFMGENYDKIDCYELVVNGLKNMGVKYNGDGGLGTHLIDKALNEGRPRNYYLNGEGLLSATGHSVYNKSFIGIRNPTFQAQSAMQDMEKVLKEGQILSFSTRTRGHTGVISKKDGVWTFINSGYMDNNIAGTNGKKQVGEEILSKELENWFKLAGNKKDGLIITLGNIDLLKLTAYRDDKAKVSQKA